MLNFTLSVPAPDLTYVWVRLKPPYIWKPLEEPQTSELS